MKWVKTVCCVFLSMNELWLPNALMLQLERKPLTPKHLQGLLQFRRDWSNPSYIYSTYTVWYVRQLKLFLLRQNRKFADGEARNGRIFFWNQLLMKSSLSSCAWLKLASFTSPRASRAFDEAGLLLLEAWDLGKICYKLNLHSRTVNILYIVRLDLPWWRRPPGPGPEQKRFFGRKASRPQLGMSCGFPGSISRVWPGYFVWDVQPWGWGMYKE